MIILITYEEKYRYNHRGEKVGTLKYPIECVSHGVDSETLENIVLPQESLSSYREQGAFKYQGEWVMT